MPYAATVFRILIGGPGDAVEHRRTAERLLHEWNSQHSVRSGIILRPILWEGDSRPEYGGHPQEIINRQLVRDCDAMIAVFVGRIGTATKTKVSGTVEELEEIHGEGKSVMIYIYDGLVDQKTASSDQFQALKGFREGLRSTGLLSHFDSLNDLEAKVRGHVALLANEFAAMLPQLDLGGRPDDKPPPDLKLSEQDWQIVQRTASVVADHAKPWKVLSRSRSRSLTEAKSLLQELRDSFIHIDVSASASLSEHEDDLLQLASEMDLLSRHPTFRDGRLQEVFWQGGAELFARLGWLVESMKQTNVLDKEELKEFEYRQAILQSEVHLKLGGLSYNETKIQPVLCLGNQGFHVAKNVILAKVLSEGAVTTVRRWTTLSVKEEVRTPVAIPRIKTYEGEEKHTDVSLPLVLQYSDGLGVHQAQYELTVKGSPPKFNRTLAPVWQGVVTDPSLLLDSRRQLTESEGPLEVETLPHLHSSKDHPSTKNNRKSSRSPKKKQPRTQYRRRK